MMKFVAKDDYDLQSVYVEEHIHDTYTDFWVDNPLYCIMLWSQFSMGFDIFGNVVVVVLVIYLPDNVDIV